MMKRLLLTATCMALAACGSNEAEAPAGTTAQTQPTPMASAAPVAANSGAAGTYEMKMADGTTVRQQLNTDGSYSYSDMEGNQIEGGIWREQGTQLCLDPQGADPETCYTGGQPASDGSFAMMDAQGDQIGTVRKTADATRNDMAPAS